MSADDAVQLSTYNNVEPIIMVAQWEVCCIGRACDEAWWHIVHACFTVLFWAPRTTGPTRKYCSTQHHFIHTQSTLKKEKKNVKPQTVHRNSIKEHASAVEK